MLKTLVIFVVVFYAVAIAVMYFAQRRFIYFPDPTRTTPRAAGLANVLERIIATPDGEKIVAWYGKAAPGQPTLLYFHGNGGALEVRAERIAKYLDRGRGLFMMSYRGYSGSTGSPSEAANVADAKLAYEALIEDGVSPDDIILYGESLGTGVAIEVAAEKKVAGVILDSPFTSIVERAAQLYPWLPVRLLLQDRYDSIQPHPRRSRADIHSPRRSRRHRPCRYGATIVPSRQRAEGDPDAPRRRARGSLQVRVVRNHQSMDRQAPRRATVSAELSIATKQKTRERFAGL